MQMSAFRTVRAFAFGFAGVLLLGAGVAHAANPPTPSEVLTDLHKSNSREVAMGKLAQKNGHSKEVKDFSPGTTSPSPAASVGRPVCN